MDMQVRYRVRKRVLEPLEQDVQGVVNCVVQGLGQSVSALNS